MTGHTGRLMGSSSQLIPRREICVSKYEKFLVCRSGSFENPIPGTTWLVQNATYGTHEQSVCRQIVAADLLNLREELIHCAV